MLKTTTLLITAFALYFTYTSLSIAGDRDDDDGACPVGWVSGLTFDEEFGPGSAAVTRCIKKREKVRVVFNVYQQCKNSSCTKPFAIGNIKNAIKDYEITHGMEVGEDYKIVAVVYGPAWKLIVKGNPFESAVKDLIAKGVKVEFCQNTARNNNIKLADMVEGVTFVTAGVTAIADYQQLGYAVVTPDGP